MALTNPAFTQEGNDAEMLSGPHRHCRGSWLNGKPSTLQASREEPRSATADQCHHSIKEVLKGSLTTSAGTKGSLLSSSPQDLEKVVSNVATGHNPNRGWVKPKSTRKQKIKHQGQASNQILVLKPV